MNYAPLDHWDAEVNPSAGLDLYEEDQKTTKEKKKKKKKKKKKEKKKMMMKGMRRPEALARGGVASLGLGLFFLALNAVRTALTLRLVTRLCTESVLTETSACRLYGALRRPVNGGAKTHLSDLSDLSVSRILHGWNFDGVRLVRSLGLY